MKVDPVRTSVRDAYSSNGNSKRKPSQGHRAIGQARLVLLVLVNVAQIWILSAAVEASLAKHFEKLWPLVAASGVCWLFTISIILWWRPSSRRFTSSGYLREKTKSKGRS